MGQFDSMGLQPVGKIGLTNPKNQSGTLERNETKKKDKPKTAAAGSPPPKNPPKNPPKGPKDKDNNKGNDKNPKKNGYLDKGKK